MYDAFDLYGDNISKSYLDELAEEFEASCDSCGSTSKISDVFRSADEIDMLLDGIFEGL